MRRHLRLAHTEGAWMSTALKVAFATSDMQQVDQHFGAAVGFAVYAVDPERFELMEAVQFQAAEMNGNEDKLAAKIAALEGCIAVYSQAVGASAISQLKAAGIQAVKVSSGSDIKELLYALQDELKRGPSAWLARAIESTMPADPKRFDAMETEGWEE